MADQDATTGHAAHGLSAADSRFDRRYALGRLVAGGGGAKVYAALQVFTRRPVAIKLPHDLAAIARERMHREMEALSRVQGPGVVSMLDAGDVRGSPYIVFELYDGRTLDGLLAARGRLDVAETLKVGVELAKILARCHARGVVHRDVKPSNVFVTLHGNPQLRLLDFGIAKLMDQAPARPRLTQEHTLLGTPEYMAPEALLSSPDVDHRADIYGLGVLLFECLSGTVPFDGKYADVLLKISTTAPHSIDQLRPDIPPALARAITKSLARSPEERFSSMQEMLAALEASSTTPLDSVNLLEHDRARAPARGPADGAATLADAPRSKVGGASRRRFVRAPYTVLARIKRVNGEHVDGRIEEVSEGGLQFVGERAIDVSETVKIRFALPTSERIANVSATARWNRTMRGTNASGFEFMAIEESARDEIRRYVALMTRNGKQP